MDDSSKESDLKENTGQQNNNSITPESTQENSASSSSKKENNSDNDNATEKLLNNENNGCDTENSSTSVPQSGDGKETKHEEVANKGEASEMEMGSPEKQVTIANDIEMDQEGPQNISGKHLYTNQNMYA